jgi:hypothetical protein
MQTILLLAISLSWIATSLSISFLNRLSLAKNSILDKKIEKKLLQTTISQEDEDEQFMNNIETDNNIALAMLRKLVSSSSGWSFVGEKDGIRVERRFLSPGSFVSSSDASKGTKHACIKSTAIINARPETVFQLFVDNTKVKEYNEHCKTLEDVLKLTKLTRNNFNGQS